MNSRPCEHCIGLMREVGIKTVSYSLDSNSIITENVVDMDQSQHTSIGYRFLRHKLYPNRFIDPKIERNEEQEREKQNKKNKGKQNNKKYYYNKNE